MDRVIHLGSQVYHPVRDGEFDIAFSDLGGLRFTDVPYYSTLCVKPLPVPAEFFRMEVSATHAGGPHDEEFSLSIKIFFGIEGSPDSPNANARCFRLKRYVHRVFEPIAQPLGFTPGGGWMPYFFTDGQLLMVEAFYREFKRSENPILAAYISPFLTVFHEHLASFKDTLLFLCHASEDKPFVDKLCAFLDSLEVAVWYDRREIRVGDSIVQCISDGMTSASHLVIVLSKASVGKPWVRKEFSSALMRQLHDASIRVLPVLIEPCEIPPLLADVRYADCRDDQARGFRELVESFV